MDVGLEEEGTKGVEYDVILEGLGSVINFDNHFRRVMVAGLRRQSYCGVGVEELHVHHHNVEALLEDLLVVAASASTIDDGGKVNVTRIYQSCLIVECIKVWSQTSK